MSDMVNIEGESTESFEEAVREIARKLEQGHPDELIEFTVTAFAYKQGSIAGFPPTYIAIYESGYDGAG